MMRRAAIDLSVRIALLGTLGTTLHAQAPAPEGWRTFQGSWSAVGRRHTVPTEGERTASSVQLSGAVVLTENTGARIGFHAEAIGFDDGASLSAGRAVWTDARGDRVFSVLRGETLQNGRRVAGTITGGTGRYAGVTGEYTLTWQYLISTDDNAVQGRTVDLTGRFRASGSRR